MITASAPGKAVFCGEYAVLTGAPAIVAAVDRRAQVRLGRAPGDVHVLTTPGYRPGEFSFLAGSAGEPQWLRPLPANVDLRLFVETWQRCRTGRSPLAIEIDTRSFTDAQTGNKLGLGSSAAAAVALDAALAQLDGEPPTGDNAFLSHSSAQGGRGSGVDIAASLSGGLLEFRRDRGAMSLSWPAAVRCQFFYSGQPASTADRLARLEAHEEGTLRLAELAAPATAAATAWAEGDAGPILDAMRGYVEALERFSVDLDLGIFDAGHERLVGLAAGTRVVYKPCGAGGGDIGVALSADPEALDRFRVPAEAAGFRALDLRLDERGVVTGEEHE